MRLSLPSSLRMYLRAKVNPVSFRSTIRTLPNAPFPTTLKSRKWLRLTVQTFVSQFILLALAWFRETVAVPSFRDIPLLQMHPPSSEKEIGFPLLFPIANYLLPPPLSFYRTRKSTMICNSCVDVVVISRCRRSAWRRPNCRCCSWAPYMSRVEPRTQIFCYPAKMSTVEKQLLLFQCDRGRVCLRKVGYTKKELSVISVGGQGKER